MDIVCSFVFFYLKKKKEKKKEENRMLFLFILYIWPFNDGAPCFTVCLFIKSTNEIENWHRIDKVNTMPLIFGQKRNTHTQLNVWINWFQFFRVAVHLFNGNNYSVGIIAPELMSLNLNYYSNSTNVNVNQIQQQNG